MPYKIIAFDGEGVGAIASAMLLEKLDPDGVLIREADLVAGGGMSAITALALANGQTSGEIVNFFRCHMNDLFALDRAGSGLYSTEPLHDRLGKLFGAGSLSELPLSGVKVMADVERFDDVANEWVRQSIGCARCDRFADMLLSELAISACSVAGHFSPHDPGPVSSPHGGRFRGCVTPDRRIARSARQYAQQHFGADADDITVLSMGAGTTNSTSFGADAEELSQNRQRWARPFTQAMRLLYEKFRTEDADHPIRLGQSCFRVQIDVDADMAFDAVTSLSDLDTLIEERTASSGWARLVETVVKDWVPSFEEFHLTYRGQSYAARGLT